MPLVAFPCGSPSTSNTRCSAAARLAARFTAVVVLPTPPFWFAMAMILAKIRQLQLVCAKTEREAEYWPHAVANASSNVPRGTGAGVFIAETQRSTEGHRVLQRPLLGGTARATQFSAWRDVSTSRSCRHLWLSVLLRVSVMNSPSLLPSNIRRQAAYCFTAQRTDTVSTTFSSPGFTGVGSSCAANLADRT